MIWDLLSGTVDFIKSWFLGKQEIAKKKQEMLMADLENRARLLRDRETFNHEWEMASLTDKDKWLRRVSFLMFAMPFFVAIFSPDYVKHYFEHALSSLPDWYIKIWIGINGSVWGISQLKNYIPQMISNVRKPKFILPAPEETDGKNTSA